jgi:hypothetical protein
MDDRSRDDALQKFVERTRVPQPTAGDLANLGKHIQRDPPRRGFTTGDRIVDRIVVWTIVSMFMVRILLKALRIWLERN